MDERTRDALMDMLEFSNELVELNVRADVEELLDDRVHRLAVERLLEMIGEAATRVPEHVRDKIDLPWNRIVGLRNRLIHAYDRTDPTTLHAIVTAHVPDVVERIEAYVRAIP